jgi:hypothetical protein
MWKFHEKFINNPSTTRGSTGFTRPKPQNTPKSGGLVHHPPGQLAPPALKNHRKRA